MTEVQDLKEGQTVEIGKTEQAPQEPTYDLENYDVERAIRIVRELGEGLIEATKHSKRHSKHHFREEWLGQLIERYRRQPGKPIIHLDDLDDQVIPTLSSSAREFLRPYWDGLVKEHGSDWGAQKYRCIWDLFSARGTASRWARLENWRRFSELTGLRINDLEPYVVALRAASTGTSRVILNPKLPFNLATPAGAKIIGYRGDAAHETSAFFNRDLDLHDDYKAAITEVLGANPFTTTPRDDGVDRTNVGVFVTQLCFIAGLDTGQRQKHARNPLPGWLFLTTDEVQHHALKAIVDTEGHPDDRSIRISQAAGFHTLDIGSLQLRWPEKPTVSRLPRDTIEYIEKEPPPWLTSSAVLLYSYGIVSYLMPERFAHTKHDYSVYWNLAFYGSDNLRKFRDIVGSSSPAKRRKLDQLVNDKNKPSSPSSFFPQTKSEKKRKPKKLKVFAAAYAIPQLEKLKLELALMVDEKGKIFDWIPGPATTSDYFGRSDKKTIRILIQQWIEDSYTIKVDLDDVKLLPAKEVDRMLFELEQVMVD